MSSFPATKGQQRRRAVGDDRPLDAVEIGPARLPIIRVAGQPDRLVRLVRDEFERPCADRVLAHVLRRHMAGIDRRISRSEQRKKGRLRLLQVKRRLVIALGGDPIEVPVPGFARVDAEFGSRLAEQHVPGALDVLCGEGLPVMPVEHPCASERSVPCRPRSTTSSVARSGTIDWRLFCGTCWSNMTRLLNTAIIGATVEIVTSSRIDMLAGLSR